jgi:hypothetical protein
MEPGGRLYEAFKPLFMSDKFSDLTIVCGKDGAKVEFKAHRNVVCQQSGFFAGAARGDFKVGRRDGGQWRVLLWLPDPRG